MLITRAIAAMLVSAALTTVSQEAHAATPTPLISVSPTTGVANGPVTVTGFGFSAGQAITVTNQTTARLVCSTTAASDGTFSCFGPAGAKPGTTSAIGVGGSAVTYSAAGVAGIATIAGGGEADGGPASNSAVSLVHGLASDPAGDLFVSDTGTNLVRRIDAVTRTITTVAGVDGPYEDPGTYGGDGGPASEAQLNNPVGLAADTAGDLLIADFGNNRIRKVDATTGIISTVAGTGVMGYSGDGGPATQAELAGPVSVAVDANGNLFIGDYRDCRVREVSASTGIISTVAGNGTCGYGGDGGPATQAELAMTGTGLIVDSDGNLYIADYFNNRVREVVAFTGDIKTVAGNGTPGYAGDGGPAVEAELTTPSSLAFDPAGNLVIADSNNGVVRSVSKSTGVITTIAGDANSRGYGGDGGPAIDAQFSVPLSVAEDKTGDLFVGDWDPDQTLCYNNVRYVNATTQIISTLISNCNPTLGGDNGAATQAISASAFGVAIDSSGNLYYSDNNANRVRKVNETTGVITTVAGNGNLNIAYGGDGGPATSAELFQPFGIALDGHNLYIADSENNRIRRVDAATGIITTVAGNGTAGGSGDGGPATSAELQFPSGVAVDSSGDLFILDNENGRIREVSATNGDITTILSGLSVGGAEGIAVDNTGHLFVAAGTLQEIDLATNQAVTIPGVSGDAVATDQHGNVFVSSQGGNIVQRVHLATGLVETMAGSGKEGFSGDGGMATEANLYQPMAVTVDSSDDVYIGQFWDGRVREVVGGPAVRITATSLSGDASTAATIGPITVHEEDAFGNPVAASAGGTTVTLQTSSPGGFFSASARGPHTTTVTIPAGASSTTFYYGDAEAGSPLITVSAAGYGASSQQVTVTAQIPTAPLSVQASAGDGQATVQWGVPAFDGGSPITSYTATASPGGATCTTSGLECTVTRLTNETSYTFAVTATNTIGTGPSSSPSNEVTPKPPSGTLIPLTPARVLDTRIGLGAVGPVGARKTVSLSVLGQGQVPDSGVAAVVLNVTVTQPKAPGYVTVYPDGGNTPNTSNLNFNAGQTIPNLVIAPVGADGKIDFYNGSTSTVQIVADDSGWFSTSP
jgi:sugar lactone lactonase YvrE